MYSFNGDRNGLLWLKVRAVSRSKQIKEFTKKTILLNRQKLSDKNIELFDILQKRDDATDMLDRFLKDVNQEWYSAMGVNAEKLKDDLFSLQHYTWGGDRNNSLDKYLISRYVKTISDFSELQRHNCEIAGNAWNYVQNSWYNNWTSFLIESIFKHNPKVVSAVGEIKNVVFLYRQFSD